MPRHASAPPRASRLRGLVVKGAFLVAAMLCIALALPGRATAGLHNAIPADASGDPNDQFADNDALFAYTTSDITGGYVCILKADAPANSTCDTPAWGTGRKTRIVGIGTQFTLLEFTYGLIPGLWRLQTVDNEGLNGEVGGEFAVTPCPGCDNSISAQAAAEAKEAANQMELGMAVACLGLAVKDIVGDPVAAARSTLKELHERHSAYRSGDQGFLATVVPVVVGFGLGFALPSFDNPGEEKALEILKDLTCSLTEMYGDVKADPADPNYTQVAQPTFGSLEIPLDPASTTLAHVLDTGTGYGEAMLHGYERYQGAVAASATPFVHAQAAATGRMGYSQLDQALATIPALRAEADRLDTLPAFAGPVVTTSRRDQLASIYTRVRTTGFTIDELVQLTGLGLSSAQIDAARSQFSLDPTVLPVDTTLQQILRDAASTIDAQLPALEGFYRSASVAAGRTNIAPTASFTAVPASGPAPLQVTFTSTSTGSDLDPLTLTWDFGDGATATGDTVTHTYTAGGDYLATLTASDGLAESSATKTISVAGGGGGNHAPIAVDDNVVVDENAQTEVFVLANDLDPDGDVLGLVDTTPPSHGTLTFGIDSFGINRIFYSPNANYVGPDSFTYTISDGRGGTATATVHVTVEAVPEATNDDFQDATPVSALPFIDREDATSATQAADDPAQSCGGTGATVWYAYTPTQDGAVETDTIGSSFPPPTVVVYTGTRGSLSEIACAQGKPLSFFASAGRTYYFMVNAYPGASVLHFAVRVPTSLSLGTLSGRFFSAPLGSGAISAKPGDPVAFTQQFPVINFNPPEDSALTCSNETAIDIYTLPFTDVVPRPDGSCTTIPAAGNGFQAGLGDLSSFDAIFTTTIHVAGAGDVAFSFYSDDGWVMGIGPGPGGAQPTYVAGSFLNPPQRSPFEGYQIVGSFNGPNAATATALVVHFPAAGDYPAEIDYSECCSGALSLTLDTNGAPTPPFSTNHAPVASNSSLTTDQDTAKDATLNASDPDGDPLSYTIVSGPAHGTLSGSGATRTYTPNPGYFGPDSFTFKANDGALDSNTSTITITVRHVNHAPVALDGTLTTDQDTAKDVTLVASDPDGDPLTYTIVSQPQHGLLSGIAPALTYTPNPGYSGPDSFTFKANDGTLDSNTATISITVRHVNHPPHENDLTVATDENTPVALTLTGSDPDGDTLTFATTSSPAHGSLSGTTPNLTYTPNPGYAGPDSFTYVASDGSLGSNTATVHVTVLGRRSTSTQTIAFGPLANKTYGDPDFAVSASASSGLAVSFTASGSCTVSAPTVHLTGTGSCTVTALQAGNATYNAAPAVSQTFSIAPKAPLNPPKTCRVPNVVGKHLGVAKSLIKRAHCRTGKVGYAYSRKRTRGFVISQSRRPGQVLPANTKINLVVSRGRKR